MPITCKICLREFEKQITNSHLKTHGTNTIQYKTTYGNDSLSSEEYKQALASSRAGENNPNFGLNWSEDKKISLSEKLKGNIPWNKGKKITATDAQLSGVNNREQKYKKGLLQRTTHVWTDEQKKAQSKNTTEYAINNSDIVKQRAVKATDTKIKNNFDFGSTMRGKHHSKETKKLISESTKKSNTDRATKSYNDRLAKITEANLRLLSSDENILELCCMKCNSVFQLTKQCFTNSKFKTSWCTICNPPTLNFRSKGEIELHEFIKLLSHDTVNSQRKVLPKKEIDVFVPGKKIAIEFNGLYWHSEDVLLNAGKSKNSDYEKMLAANELGIRYIGIFEDEWRDNQEIVKSRLRNILGCTEDRIYARKCNIQEISSKIAANFCNKHHIQGAGRSNVRYGLFHNNELVAVMTFSSSNLSRKVKTWEINRFCAILNTTVVGGASKLFAKFIKDYDPPEVISYADRRWSTGNLYKMLGFEFSKYTTPNYWYFLPNTGIRLHRFALRKTSSDPVDQTEKEIRNQQGYLRIWDCGNSKWIWKKGS